VPTEAARKRLIAAYDHDVTEQEWALGYRWNIVVGGPHATAFES
jgi:protocatechuate 3,4-dioxygenase, beta subunit